ncbi:MAG: NUDIX domain-containing protein [Armatimonadota bacterium]
MAVSNAQLPRPLAASAAIFNEVGDVLLVRLSYDQRQWTTPGGGIDPGESPAEAAVREAREETGLDVEIEALYGVYWRRDNEQIVFAFRCRVVGGALAPDGKEILEARYFPPDALPRPMTNGALLRVTDALTDGPVMVKTIDRLEYFR